MANYQQNQLGYQQPQPVIQYPYYNNGMVMNTPYDTVNNNNVRSNQQQFLKCRPVASRE